ncbi:MAG: hypothetical protein K2Q06_05295, partial [Parvularculaceae bacterium]|nr:hypothetical protein [Parvularculaceae bacterium]
MSRQPKRRAAPATEPDNLYRHGMARVAACAPRTAPGDPGANVDEALKLAREADRRRCAIAVYPELNISAYAIDDLFLQDALLDRVGAEIGRIVRASADLFPVLIVGAPIAIGPALYNCAVVVHRGRVLGVVPKTYLPNYREYYEKRHFAAGDEATERVVDIAGETAPFGVDLVFAARDCADFIFHVEICEDIWSATPPSTLGAFAGATILCNLSASNSTIGKAEERNLLCDSQSRRCAAAYIYSGAGFGESTTDLAWDGHLAAFELGAKLAESERFSLESRMIVADIDLERLR